MSRQRRSECVPLMCAVAACVVVGSIIAWRAGEKHPSLHREAPSADAAFLQISTDEEMSPDSLRCFCDEEMTAVTQLLGSIGDLTGEPLLWASNQIDSRLADVMSLGSLLREVHPVAGVRDAATHCVQSAAANASAVEFSRPLFDALKRLEQGQRRRLRALPQIDASARGREVVTSPDAVRYARESLKQYERRGVGIVAPEEQDAFFARLKALKRRMTDLSQAYESTLSADRRGVWVILPADRAANATERAGRAPGPATVDPAYALPLSHAVSLDGLPDDFVAARLRAVTPQQLRAAIAAASSASDPPLTGDGPRVPVQLPGPPAAFPSAAASHVIVLEVSTDYPDLGPAIKYATDRRLRAAAALQASRRGYPANQRTLAELLEARADFARVIAEAKAAAGASPAAAAPLSDDDCSSAGLSLQSMMAKTPEAVRGLLSRVQRIARTAGRREVAALQSLLDTAEAESGEESGLPPQLQAYDLSLLLDSVRRTAFNVSSQRTRSFFTYAQARRGVIATAGRAFGLRFAVVAAPSVGGDATLGAKAADREVDACLHPHFSKALDACQRPVVTPLDEAAVAAEAGAVPDAHRWHPSVEVIDVYNAADGNDREATERGESVFSTTPAHAADRGDYIGRLYIDAFPRADKYKHMAMFPVRPGLVRWTEPSEGSDTGAAGGGARRLAAARAGRRSSLLAAAARRQGGEGSEIVLEQHPEAALVCNFEPHGPMEHGDVVTLFHEFGHALHHLLGGRQQRFAAFSGTATETDFVEVPSQLNEAYAWDAGVLATFAARIRTSEELAAMGADASEVEPIPADLVARMRDADAAGRAVAAWRQASLAQVSLRLHMGEFRFDPEAEPSATGNETVAKAGPRMLVSPPAGKGQASLQPGDGGGSPAAAPRTCPPRPPQSSTLDAAVRLIADESSPTPHVPGSHLASNFAHLVGYGSNYYSYAWSDVIVKDVLGPFERARDASRPSNATASVADQEDPAAGSLLAARGAAARYRRDVLEAGGRLDGDQLVSGFLGRPFAYGAYEAWLGEGAIADWIGGAVAGRGTTSG